MELNEQDFAEALGVEIGGNDPEPADPEVQEAEAENGAGEAGGTEETNDTAEGSQSAEEAGSPAGGTEPETGDRQTDEENARFAAARRKAERDAEIKRIRDEASRQMDEMVKRLGIKDPFTGEILTTKEQYDKYQDKLNAERKDRLLKKAGLSDSEYEDFVRTIPEVRKAEAAQAEAERIIRDARDRQAQERIDAQLKEIHALDPGITSLEDLSKTEAYQELYEKVKAGYSILDAFKLVNFSRLTAGAAAAAKQQAINQVSSKAHLRATNAKGKEAINVPEEEAALARELMPGISNDEIRRYYAKYKKK